MTNCQSTQFYWIPSFFFSDNEKVVNILTGRKYPQHQEHQKLIQLKGKTICEMLKPIDILPSLVSKGVIAAKDKTVILNKEQRESSWYATIDLLDKLPEKNINWYKLFMEALIESNHEGLAKELDEKVYNSKYRDKILLLFMIIFSIM